MPPPDVPDVPSARARTENSSDPSLQELAEYAGQVVGTPVALVTELGAERQTFLANAGFGRDWTTLEESFCAHAVLHEGVFEVRDATKDPRFADNPLRFYAGVPVRTGEGAPRNALCVLDTEPRALTDFQRGTLEMLARQVEARLALRRHERELEAERARAAEANEMLRLVTDRLPVRVAYVDQGFRYRFLNGEYARVFGRPIEDAIGRPVAELVGDAAFDAGRPLIQRALTGEAFAQTLEVPYPFGTMWVETRFTPVTDSGGEIVGTVVQAADVTERTATEQVLATSEAHYRTLFQSIDDGFCTYEMIFDEAGVRWTTASSRSTTLSSNRPA